MTCDLCGRPLPKGGQTLWDSVRQAVANRLGRYGPDCRVKVVTARTRHGLPTYNDRGRQLRNADRPAHG